MKIKNKIAVFLSVILGMTMNIPDPVKGAIPDGPANKHESTIYTYDYESNAITSNTSDETWPSWTDSPLMFPGDKVIIKGEESDMEEEMGTEDNVLYKGLVFLDDEGVYSTDSQGPIKVLDTQQYGSSVDPDHHDNTFITEFEITGEDIVKIYSNGGGGYAAEDTVYGRISYYVNYFKYYSLPAYCNVSYDAVYYNNGYVSVGDEVLKTAIYKNENPDIIYAEDAITNLNDNSFSYSICRPYIEGFAINTNGSVNQGDSSQVYDLKAESGNPFATSEIETYYPKWTYKVNSGEGMIGSYDDEIKVQFVMTPVRTVTLDTCGGKLDDREIVVKENVYDYYAQEEYPEYMTDGSFVPTKEGYEFKGWFKDKTYTEEVTADNITDYIKSYSTSSSATREERSCRMFAKWEKICGEEENSETGDDNSSTDGDIGDINDNSGDTDKGSSDSDTSVKLKNTIEVKTKAITIKYKKLKKKAQKIAKKKVFKISGAKGKVTFKKLSGNKKIKINNKTGKITVKKGLKKKTYKIKVKVTAGGTSNYKTGFKTVVVKIKVK